MEENKMKQPASADAPQTAEDSVLHVDRDRAQQKTKDIDMETAPEKPVSAHKCLESMPLKILGLLGICALIIGEVFVITGLYLGAQYRVGHQCLRLLGQYLYGSVGLCLHHRPRRNDCPCDL